MFGQSAPTPNTSVVGADCRDLTSMSKSPKFFYLVRDPMFGQSAPTPNTSPIGADCRDLTSMSKSPKFFYWVRDPMFGQSAPTQNTSVVGADCWDFSTSCKKKFFFRKKNFFSQIFTTDFIVCFVECDTRWGPHFRKKKISSLVLLHVFFWIPKKFDFGCDTRWACHQKKFFSSLVLLYVFSQKTCFFFSKWVRIPKFGQSAPTPNTSLIGADCWDLTSMSKSRKFFYWVRDPMFGHSAPTPDTSLIGADCWDFGSRRR